MLLVLGYLFCLAPVMLDVVQHGQPGEPGARVTRAPGSGGPSPPPPRCCRQRCVKSLITFKSGAFTPSYSHVSNIFQLTLEVKNSCFTVFHIRIIDRICGEALSYLTKLRDYVRVLKLRFSCYVLKILLNNIVCNLTSLFTLNYL